jgi:hypothetical protein
MHKFTVTLQHVSCEHVKEIMSVYAPNTDSAWGTAHRAAGNWYRVISLESKTCKN